jgi:phosphoribosylanthranilate isomerase
MALKTFVKVGSISNLSDARYCAGMGADLLGVRVVPGQENYINPQQFQEIRGWVTGPQIVAEIYGMQQASEIADIQENYRPDLLEFGLQELHVLEGNLPLPYILSLRSGEQVPPACTPAYILVQESTEHLKQLALQHPVLIEVQTAANVPNLLKHVSAKGLALQGGHEIRPGLKEYDQLSEILEMLDAD